MTALRERMIEDLQLHGLSNNTQVSCVRSVRFLAEYYRKPPDQITEEELREYFLFLIKERRVPPSTFRIALCGIKFFYEHTLQKHWVTLELARPPAEKKLPVVLTIDEVRQVLGCLRSPRYRVCLSTIYACGLRIQEGTHLRVQDIDGERKMIHVCHGKGGKDRYVPLPEPGLEMLRRYWVTHRHPIWLFPSPFGVEDSCHQQLSPSLTMEYGGPSIVQCRNVSSRNRRPSILYATPMQRICSMPGYPCALSRLI